MRGKRLLIAGLVVSVALAGVMVAWRARRARAVSAPPPKVESPLPPEVALSGKIRAQHVVSVGATVDGTIEAFLADVGQEVEEGQLVARVSNQGLETGREVAQIALSNTQTRITKIEAQIVAARLEASRASADASRARLEYERTDKTYRRQRMLHGEGATPRLMYEKSEREFETAQADLQSLERMEKQADARIQSLLEELQTARKILDDKQKQLEDASGALAGADIYAPVSGIVVGRNGEVGKSAKEAGDDLFQIATDITALEVVVEPEPPVLQRIKPGLPALVFISDFQAEGVPARVKEIKDTLVTVEFASPNPAIKPGLTADARIKLD